MFAAPFVLVLLVRVPPVRSQTSNYEFNDSHFSEIGLAVRRVLGEAIYFQMESEN
jgi:hypothetical protein